MKNLAYLILLFCILISCSEDNEQNPIESPPLIINSYTPNSGHVGDEIIFQAENIDPSIEYIIKINNLVLVDISQTYTTLIGRIPTGATTGGFNIEYNGTSLFVGPYEVEEELPSGLVLNVNPFFDNAEIFWTVEGGINNKNLLYDIYLNEELIIENLSEQNYLLEGLDIATSYQLEVLARNQIGTTSEIISFVTLDPNDFDEYVLSQFKIGDHIYFYEYDPELNYLVSANKVNEEQPWENIIQEFEYDLNGNIISNFYGASWGTITKEYAYSNNELIEASNRIFDGFGGTTDIYAYIGNNMFSLKRYDDFNGLYAEHTIMLEKDTEGRTTRFSINNWQGETHIVNFVYGNGNLVQIVEQNNNNVWDIEYDSYSSYITNYSVLDKMKLPFLNNYISGLEKHFVSFLGYTNQNNPITIKLNGVVQKEVFYEYNSLGYPSKVTNWHGTLIYELEYILL